MIKLDPPQSILFAGLAALTVMTACGPDPSRAPTTGDEVKERAIEAQTARKRTGAEVQDRILNNVIHAGYLCDNGERQLLRAIEKLTRQSLPFTDRRSPGGRQEESAERPQGKNTRGNPQAKRNGPARPRRDAPRVDAKAPGAKPPGAKARPDNREEASGGFRSRPRRAPRREARATS